ncbi:MULTISPECIES: S8/S53 family peptidase [unclassified Oceanispirochaeta]|uniref:S8/S53 family peptidase n=1 Tax=unclassified Oceanispirochaeta TaxID=2635722 RepID=UPI000E09C60F|nr:MULTISPECIES: S8/S53 family peptidase [unclassified Oceanispirochaeta]MBF9018264.1 S8/S53 family peptidase [Oceanispirochaeta sp. M2]NPD74729.1 S8/S53 family peptidase [Oceanispirochaeta sp. M1]RDG29398.1 peptidase [Oceanispirochaeta sp. M1]
MLQRSLLFYFFLILILIGCSKAPTKEIIEIPYSLHFENANSRITYFTVHNIREGWSYSKGKGIKIGILDNAFGFDEHSELYKGGLSFQNDQYREVFNTMAGHGYWMASTLHEIAPEAEIYALGVFSNDEDYQVESMLRAIDWAIANHLDILTYSGARISEKNRIILDGALDKLDEKGILTTFIHCPHEMNILPSEKSPPIDEIENTPLFNIYKYDYSTLFPYDYVDYSGKWNTNTQKPFLSISSTSPVLAGFIAMIISIDSTLNSDEIKELLLETSYTFETDDIRINNAVNIGAAVRSLKKEQ